MTSIDFSKCRALKTGNIATPKGRLAFTYLIEPNEKAKTKDGKAKYQTSLLLPPNSDLALLKEAAAKCAKEKWPNKTSGIKSPFLDAHEKGQKDDGSQLDGFEEGWTLLRLSSVSKPQIVGPNGQPAKDDDLYAGRWASVSVRPYAYDQDGNKGVSFGLVNVQLLDHDKPFAGARAQAEDEFGAVEGFDSGAGEGSTADDMFS